jgi:hypothetical protein
MLAGFPVSVDKLNKIRQLPRHEFRAEFLTHGIKRAITSTYNRICKAKAVTPKESHMKKLFVVLALVMAVTGISVAMNAVSGAPSASACSNPAGC